MPISHKTIESYTFDDIPAMQDEVTALLYGSKDPTTQDVEHSRALVDRINELRRDESNRRQEEYRELRQHRGVIVLTETDICDLLDLPEDVALHGVWWEDRTMTFKVALVSNRFAKVYEGVEAPILFATKSLHRCDHGYVHMKIDFPEGDETNNGT